MDWVRKEEATKVRNTTVTCVWLMGVDCTGSLARAAAAAATAAAAAADAAAAGSLCTVIL